MNEVKSKGERIIKELLDESNIKYVYEYPLLIMERRDEEIKQRIWYLTFGYLNLG
jgi:hypothetical protein